jgi:acyl dehydratase/NAD(P)-dependent dehydrogenase (short-subunit alcohol dehydrogenase family)
VEVTPDDATAFAALSGDWNPLHTNPEHAARTAYRRPVLHGAFSAGIVSRMAGMHLPGVDCLLHSMRLRFVAPIVPPAALMVRGREVATSGDMGRVDVAISDDVSGMRYVDAVYEFSRHEVATAANPAEATAKEPDERGDGHPPILVTGATGGLGQAVLARLGGRARGVARTARPGMLATGDLEQMVNLVRSPIAGIVHCAWPPPDNERLTSLTNIEGTFEHNLGAPLRQIIALAQLLARQGTSNAMLVLVGSSAALPGRHNYRSPLYSLSKALIPELTRILATELASSNKRCAAVTYDVIDGGMNKRLSTTARVAHIDRVPSGALPTMDEAAAQIEWVLDNATALVSGATITLTGAAAP